MGIAVGVVEGNSEPEAHVWRITFPDSLDKIRKKRESGYETTARTESRPRGLSPGYVVS